MAGLTVDEVIRMPQRPARRRWLPDAAYPLALVQTRVRSIATEVTRTDEEFAIARVVDLPTARAYRLDGTAQLAARAPTPVLDRLLGRDGRPTVDPR